MFTAPISRRRVQTNLGLVDIGMKPLRTEKNLRLSDDSGKKCLPPKSPLLEAQASELALS